MNQALNNADCLIVHTALEFAHASKVTSIVVNDTDVFIFVVCHFKLYMPDIYLYHKTTSSKSSRNVILSIRSIYNTIDEQDVRQLLALHAISGCDSTSSLFGHENASVWHKNQQK